MWPEIKEQFYLLTKLDVDGNSKLANRSVRSEIWFVVISSGKIAISRVIWIRFDNESTILYCGSNFGKNF